MARRINTGERGSGVLKDGIYQLKVLDAEEKTSQSGNEMVQLQFAVMRRGQAVGRAIYDNLIFLDNSMWKFDQFHDALAAPENLDITCQWYKGKTLYATLTTDEYRGKIKNVIDSYIDPTVAIDMLEKQGAVADNGSDQPLTSPAFEDSGMIDPVAREKAKGRGRPKNAAVAEEDTMPM